MFRTMCKSKIHRATLTQTDLNYEGSITIDPLLIEAANLLPYEQVQVVNVNTGGRFETYVIPGQRGTGVIGLNGAAARLGAVGDVVIIISYGQFTDEEARALIPIRVFVDATNTITERVQTPAVAVRA
ncbi:MAG: aspartate 1-decarboxylase [Ktedonobacterales bacterium]|nr:aspartate 1-decarboxylase [Ktedonobacterales bacterium]